jgi:predicted phage-related endonuclease
MEIDLETKTIKLDSVRKKPKKITGTRFAAILGLNPWCTPFETWCDITGTYKTPFEDNKYTTADKVIEPKVIEYLDKKYYFGRGLIKTPEQYFGKTKEQMRYDHFHEEMIFGGMWDARTDDIIHEIKTSKRIEDWFLFGQFSAPEYYKLQGALYAYLTKLEKWRMSLTALEEKDYEDPEAFVPTSKNTHVITYRLQDEYPQFDRHLDRCEKWYKRHVIGGISPVWDDKRDAEIIKALRTSHIAAAAVADKKDPVTQLLMAIEPLQEKIDTILAGIAEDEKILKRLKEQLKPELQGRMKDSDKKIVVDGALYSVELTKAAPSGIDTERLKADGLYEQYKKTDASYKLNINKKEIAS